MAGLVQGEQGDHLGPRTRGDICGALTTTRSNLYSFSRHLNFEPVIRQSDLNRIWR